MSHRRRTVAPARRTPRHRITALVVPLLLVVAGGALAVPAGHAAAESGSTVGQSAASLTVRVAARGPRKAVLAWRLEGPAQSRQVQLQRRTPHTQWRTLREAQVAPGDHRSVIRPRSLGRYQYRVHAPAAFQQAEASSGAVHYARSVGYRPRGRAHQHSSLFSTHARWDPCSTITWRANLDGAWPGALRNLKKAVRRTAWASGLSFRYAGTTRVVPDGSVDQEYDEGTDLVVAWARPGTTPLLPRGTTVLGVGGGVSWDGVVDELDRPAYEIRTGRVVINTRAAHLDPGFGPGATRGALLMHELGHAIGLGHVSSRAQLMNPTMQLGLDRWGRGDLRGLAVRGAPRGCLNPAPFVSSPNARLAPNEPESADLP